jgi:hypothetical protein
MNAPVIQIAPPTREYAVTLLKGGFRAAVESLPPELVRKTELELEADRTPTEVDYLLRKNFWKQVDLAQKGVISDIKAVDVYAGACSDTNFEERVLKSPIRLAWILTYPSTPDDLMEAGLNIALKNMIKFVSREPNEDTASAFMKAVEILLNRVKGPVIQKIQAQHAHLNMNKPIVNQNPNARIEELKNKLVSRDVTPSKNE